MIYSKKFLKSQIISSAIAPLLLILAFILIKAGNFFRFIPGCHFLYGIFHMLALAAEATSVVYSIINSINVIKKLYALNKYFPYVLLLSCSPILYIIFRICNW